MRRVPILLLLDARDEAAAAEGLDADGVVNMRGNLTEVLAKVRAAADGRDS
jgi:hypothetical protein